MGKRVKGVREKFFEGGNRPDETARGKTLTEKAVWVKILSIRGRPGRDAFEGSVSSLGAMNG